MSQLREARWSCQLTVKGQQGPATTILQIISGGGGGGAKDQMGVN